MQLKLRLGAGESLTIDVKPGDTFQDLSDKVFKQAGIKIDLNQLKSGDVPFDMSTNVIQYFAPKLVLEADKRTPKLCRLCSKPIIHDVHFLFEKQPNSVTLADKVNIALPIYVTTKDHMPKQICSFCMKGLNHSFEFVKRVLAAQKNLENVVHTNRQKPSTSTECCPLCQTGTMKAVEPKNGSLAPPSPKRETVVKKEMAIPVPRNSFKSETPEETPKEFFEDDEVVVGFWDGIIPNKKVDLYTTSSMSQTSGERRYRKKIKMEDDNEWSIEEEYIPISRRGRPKGAKNKPKIPVIVEDKSCAICGWLGPETDMLHHAVNQHCQPDMGYFPCPLCKTNQANELVLENHLLRHASSSSHSSMY